jgi:hypothetical protein
MIPSFIPWQHLTLAQKEQLRDENINDEQSWYNSKGSGYARMALYSIVRGIKAQLAFDTAQAADLQACAWETALLLKLFNGSYNHLKMFLVGTHRFLSNEISNPTSLRDHNYLAKSNDLISFVRNYASTTSTEYIDPSWVPTLLQ